MGKFRTVDVDPGWIKRKFAELDRRVTELSAAKRLGAATIGSGGVTIKDGGGVVVGDNGAFTATYPGGQESVRFGPARTADGRATQALTVRDEVRNVVFGANRTPYDPEFPEYPDGQRVVQAGGLRDDAAPSDNSVDLVYFHAGPGIFVMNNIGTITLDGGPDGGVKIGHSTIGASANCYISETGLISRSTSSRRYKQDVEDVEVDPSLVLQMRPRTWRDRGEVEREPDSDQRYVGFIAEELDELGLSQFVVYNADGEPDAISYDRLAVALLSVVKDQERRLSRLEALLPDSAA